MAKTADAAIEAMKQGAYDYLYKPLDPHQLRRVVGEAVQVARRMREPAVVAETGLPDPDVDGAIVGTCPAMREVYKAIGRVTAQNVPVLITGESGTGKELVARAIYQHGPRAKAPFLALNCAAIPENLLESELFGHEKGAFTGADRRRIGKFEQCSGGTIFLDEVGDMPLSLQAKVLRLLQEQEFERVGGNEKVRTDVRLIAATHRDLAAWMDEGKFRADLYYRLGVFAIHLPSLREPRRRPRASGAALPPPLQSGAGPGGAGHRSRGAGAACAATSGRATYGSCRACSSSAAASQWPGPAPRLPARARGACRRFGHRVANGIRIPPRANTSANDLDPTRTTCMRTCTESWIASCCAASWNTQTAIRTERPACSASPDRPAPETSRLGIARHTLRRGRR